MNATPSPGTLGHSDVADRLNLILEAYRHDAILRIGDPDGDRLRLLDAIARVLTRMALEISTSTAAGSPVPASMLRRYVLQDLADALDVPDTVVAGRRILRWEIPIDDQDHQVAASGPVIAAEARFQPAGGVLSFWTVEFEPAAAAWMERGEGTERTFRAFATGQPIPPRWRWWATAPRVSGLVFHLCELVP